MNPDRAAAIFQEDQQRIFCRTDRSFLVLMLFQWVAGIAAASWLSPRAWEGNSSHVHPHIWAALVLGGIITSFPVALAWLQPGRTSTRHIIAASQILMSALLIHLSGGRIETHFHIFGSLAFLAFYRDWRVLVTASFVMALDHFARGVWWPESVYGTLSAPVWRAFEHTGWVVFEDVFLLVSIRQSVRDMRGTALRQAALEATNAGTERAIIERTAELSNEIAERQRSEEALRNSEQLFRQLNENIQDVFWLTSPTLHELYYVSPAYEKIWRRSVESLRARPLDWAEAIFEEDRAKALNAFASVSETRQAAEVEYRIRTPSGEVRWIADRGFPIYDADGRLYRMAGIARDVTEKKRACEALRESEHRFRHLVHALPVATYTCDAQGFVTLFNRAAVALWGREPDLGKDRWGGAWRLLNADGSPLPIDQCTMAPTIRHGRAVRGVEVIVERPDATRSSILTYPELLRDESGALIGAVNMLVDITERKQLEARLIEGYKLQTAGRLAGHIAHDFNSILTSIIGHAAIIQGEVPDGGELFHHAVQIEESASRAATLTQQLLAFSRKQMLQPVLIDVNSLVADAQRLLHGLLGESIRVSTVLNSRHSWTKADASQIQQVLVQLALNARDAMPKGGRLALETADITLDENYASAHSEVTAGEYVMIAISDTGTGIPDDVKEHMFEPFFTTKPVGQGTGLGLAMCYGNLKQIGGHLSLYSEVGIGTTCKVFLPRASAPDQSAAGIAPKNGSAILGSENILLVEDDESLRDLASTVLKKLGYTVYSAANGEDALRAAQRAGDIDLLLTDMVMPGMDGRELAEALKTTRSRMKVLFTSAYTEEALSQHGFRDAGATFLHKPYTPNTLSQKAREALSA